MPAAPFRRIVLLGAPGVGKGTYARRLGATLGLEHVVVGDLVRGEIKAGSAVGRRIQGYAARGDLVPDGFVLDLVFAHLDKTGVASKGFLLDGIPRTIAQAQALDARLPPDLALHLTMDEEVMLLKMTARRLGPDNNVYNVAYIKREGWDMPPLLPEPTHVDEANGTLRCAHGSELRPNEHVTCARCVGGLTMRADDTEDVCRHRLREYKAQSLPVVDHYAPIRLDFEIDGGVTQCLPRLLALVTGARAAGRGEGGQGSPRSKL